MSDSNRRLRCATDLVSSLWLSSHFPEKFLSCLNNVVVSRLNNQLPGFPAIFCGPHGDIFLPAGFQWWKYFPGLFDKTSFFEERLGHHVEALAVVLKGA